MELVRRKSKRQKKACLRDNINRSPFTAQDKSDRLTGPLFEFLQRLSADAAGRDRTVAGTMLVVIADSQRVDGDTRI
jgi:hypothetical protein